MTEAAVIPSEARDLVRVSEGARHPERSERSLPRINRSLVASLLGMTFLGGQNRWV
jgi:hypothetical protein